LLWVHATFVDSLLCIGQRLHGRLSTAQLRDFYRDAVTVGEVFGCSAGRAADHVRGVPRLRR
jgi:uncharacterized protein (DUF2236 family)